MKDMDSGEELLVPEFEIFRATELEVNYNLQNMDHANRFTIFIPGWYWKSTPPFEVSDDFPDPPFHGPFDTEEIARKDAESR